jgi:hypothetical protein
MWGKMKQTFKLSPQVVDQLAQIEGNARNLLIALSASVLLVHLLISYILYISGQFLPTTSLFLTLWFLGFLVYVPFRGYRYYRQYYSSYEIELSEHAICFRQLNRRTIEIQKENIQTIQELVPEGELYVKAIHGRRVIDVYSLLLRDNPVIIRELRKWKAWEKISLSPQKVATPMITILSAFFAPILFALAFTYPGFIPLGLFTLGYSLVGFFQQRKWPVREARIRNALWVIFLPAIASIPLVLLNIFWIYMIVGNK